MCDTVKIERPLFCRRREDRGGRSNRDAQGHPIKVKTRAADSLDMLELSWLSATAAPESSVGPD
jgi:hypothetical protein